MPGAPRILGVDDNPRNLTILRKSLAHEYDLVTAASGEEALETATRWLPDVILLDIMMPGIDGYETCRRLRAIPSLAGTKVIMLSAKAMTSERLEGYAAGADDYVVKPFDQDELIAKVRVYLRLKSVEELDRLKSDVLDLLSHETATPLSGIFGALGLLRESPGLTDEHLELIEVADDSVERLQGLVKRVCLISRLKASRREILREPQSLNALAGFAVETSREAAGKLGITLVLDAPEDAPVIGDGVLLSWVVEVLLSNAIRFSARGRSVEVRVSSDGVRSSITVSDHGPGIEASLLPRIFDEFVVAEILHHKRGSGLSLAAARLIAEQHGGTLSAESEPGQGATFRLELAAAVSARVAA